MDVFVIPVGREKYELYCEKSSVAPVEDPEPPGLIGRMRHRVAVMLHAAEQRQHQVPDHGEERKGFIGRLQDRMMAWVVERIAEQRLLWNLRTETTAVAAHPQDMAFDDVHRLILTTLRHDYYRHRRWLIIDLVLFVVTFVFLGPLFLIIPGVANLPALYFGFRVILHFLSMRGAAQGLYRVHWSGRPCAPLGELRDVGAMEPRARTQRIHDIAERLRLQHLSTFFERVAVAGRAG